MNTGEGEKIMPTLLKNTMKLKKIGHCGGYEMTRKEVLNILSPTAPVLPKIKESDGKKFLVLQGNTQIMGFLVVLQSIVKSQGYKRSDVVAISKNLSVFAIA